MPNHKGSAMRLPVSLLFVAIASLAQAKQPQFDLLIRNGRVIDGDGNRWSAADVAVRGERIVAIGKLAGAKATREIDATGLVIAPGFIDMHSHSDMLLLEDGHAQSKIRQGVTTEVLGEGSSAGPNKGKLQPEKITVGGKELSWTTLDGYFRGLETSKISVNVASYVGLDNLWQGAMGKSFERPTAAQFGEMKTLLDEAMRDGGRGLSTIL